MASRVIAALESLRARQVRAIVLRAAPGMDIWSAAMSSASSPRASGTRWVMTTRWKS